MSVFEVIVYDGVMLAAMAVEKMSQHISFRLLGGTPG